MVQQQKIKKLENDYTRQRELDFQSSKGSGSLRQRRKKRACVIVAFFAVFAIIFSVQIVRAKVNYNAVNTQISKQKMEEKKAQAQHSRLSAQVARLNDKNYVEQLIRDRYYYTKPGETVYSFPNQAAKDVNSGAE